VEGLDHTLDYLLESLSNWVDTHAEARTIYRKLVNHPYQNERAFAKALSPEESHFLTDILTEEMHYAQQEQDDVRLGQLNEVYEQLY
jgi:hypothetical protein